MSKHTPGPWSVGEVSHKKQRVDIDSLHADQTVGHQTWRGLARAYGCEDMPAEGTAAMLANARLIAAAPELLEALEQMVSVFLDTEGRHGESENDAMDAARDAIAKATGENTMTTKDEALKLSMEALELSQSYLDHLSYVIGFEKKNPKPASTSWYVQRAITACREALAQKDEQEPVAWKRRLVEIHDALSYELGDTDPHIEDDMTDEEVREEMPVFWAAKEVATLIGDAPWDSLPSASTKRQPHTE